MIQDKTTYLSAQELTHQASQTPNLETFAYALVKDALLAAADKLDADKLETDAVTLDAEITIKRHPAVDDLAGGCYMVQVCTINRFGAKVCHQTEVCWGPRFAQ